MSRYEPLSLLTQLQRELERSYENKIQGTETSATAEWAPAVDIQEEKDRYVVWADLPGVAPTAIDIVMENGVLTLKGEKSVLHAESKEGLKRRERVTGTFYRRFTLPDTADAESITAKSDHGVLEISIPKKAQLQPKRIEVISKAA